MILNKQKSSKYLQKEETNKKQMKKQIIKLGDRDYKTLGYSDKKMIYSTKQHQTFESLSYAIEKSGLTESIKTISIDTIKN